MPTGRCRPHLDEGAHVGKVGVHGAPIGEVLAHPLHEVAETAVGQLIDLMLLWFQRELEKLDKVLVLRGLAVRSKSNMNCGNRAKIGLGGIKPGFSLGICI